jgi:cyclopropane-fatty-acyl-phospholipid synthase
MWTRLLDGTLRRAVKRGSLEVEFPDGRLRRYGQDGEAVRIALRDPALPRRMLFNADLALGEAWMDGTLQIEGDDLRGFMAVANMATADGTDVAAFNLYRRMSRLKRRLHQAGGIGRARANVAHHYDLSPRLYDLFLDTDRTYSCAYFERPGMSLEEAQAAKRRHVLGKLLLEPGMRVLDIGSGWGGLAIEMARDHGARVLGVTLSEEQLAHARAGAEREGLSGRVEFRLQDYRAVEGTFDRIVSVGMFEHVGVPNYGAYFRALRDRLAPDGVALVHTIGRLMPPGATSPWIQKYIFPGGYVPALSEMMRPIEALHLQTTDVEVWRMHYAETLRHWYERFVARAEEAERLYDARFVRMWRWYLAGCEMNFRHHRQAVFQVQLARRKDAVPITRDYLYPAVRGVAQAAE